MEFKNSFKFLLIQLFLLIHFNGNYSFAQGPNQKCLGPNQKFTQNLRLPNDTKPINYNISISIDHIKKQFTGIANIEILTINATKNITLHFNKLKVLKINVNSLIDNNNYVLIKDINYKLDDNYNKTHFLIIYCENNEFQFESNQKYLLSIKYEGEIERRQTKGIYLSETNEYSEIITTQFEPTFARRAFPCYDEPHFKARFQISLTHSSLYSALSNMPLDGAPTVIWSSEPTTSTSIEEFKNSTTNSNANTTDATMTVTTKFQQTPLMSTYLLAFILHNYHSTSLTVNNVTHSVYYNNLLLKKKAEYTLKKSVELLTAMEDYFQVKYPLPKLDHIGVPAAFGHAMENWGIIIYREDKYLLDSECGTLTNLKVIVTIAHEMVHQWFGNLVSPKWWSYIWLNEGFATYYSYIIMKKVFPECVNDDFYYYDSMTYAFTCPCKRPLTVDLMDEEDVINAFDLVSYHRGAAVIRMLGESLTEKTFRRGIYNYLNKFKYDSVTEDDLFACLEEAAIQDDRKYFNKKGFLSDFIKTWTHNRGYPEVSVERNYTSNQLLIKQNPIAMNFDKKWFIPMSISTSSVTLTGKKESLIDFIVPPEESFTVDLNDLEKNINITAKDWIMVNNNILGLYNVYYDLDNWKLLAEALNKNKTTINVINRNQILRDFFLRTFKYEKNFELQFEILSYLKHETDMLPWAEIIDRLQTLDENFSWCNIYPKFKEFLHDILTPITKWLLNEEISTLHGSANSDNYKIPKISNFKLNPMKKEILKLSCSVGIEECLMNSYKHLNCSLSSNHDFFECFDESDNSEQYYCGGIRKTSVDEFQFMLQKVFTVENVPFFVEILEIFKCTENQEHLTLLLNMILEFINNSTIEDKTPLYHGLREIGRANRVNMKLTLQFIFDNIENLQKEPINLKKLLQKLYHDDIADEFKSLHHKILNKLEDGNNYKVVNLTELDILDFNVFFNRRFFPSCDKATEWLNNYKIKSDKSGNSN